MSDDFHAEAMKHLLQLNAYVVGEPEGNRTQRRTKVA